jgi:hypothetical protein
VALDAVIAQERDDVPAELGRLGARGVRGRTGNDNDQQGADAAGAMKDEWTIVVPSFNKSHADDDIRQRE